MVIRAFAPANISFVFKIHDDLDPQKAGSFGVGATLNRGATVTVTKSDKILVSYNGEHLDFPAVSSVITALTAIPVSVAIESPFSLGSGFGMSGASALATAYALNELLQLQKTKKELAVIAHTADVVNKSGLGDVANQYFGGCLLKVQPSSDFVVEKLPFINCKVYCQSIRKLATASVLTNKAIRTALDKAANETLAQIKQKKDSLSFGDLISLAKQFAISSTLLQDNEVKQKIEAIEQEGGKATMIMLGNGLVSTIPFEGATEYTISDVAAHLL